MRKVYYIRRPRPSVRVKPSFSRGELTNEAGIGATDSASAAPLTLASSLIPRPFALGGLKADNEFLSDSAPATPKKGEPSSPAVARKPASAPQTAGTPAQAQPPAASAMESDQRFQGVTSRLEILAGRERYHQPLRDKMTQAEQATKQPQQEPTATGMSVQVEAMSEEAEKTGARQNQSSGAKESSFEILVTNAIEKLTPKTASDMEDFGKHGEAENVHGEIRKNVSQQEAETKNVESETKHDPDPTGVEGEPASLPADPLKGAPGRIGAKDVLPEPKPDDQVSMEADKHEAADDLANTGLTEDQLAEGNEPLFNSALAAKKEVLENSDAAPARFRKEEAEFLTRSRAEVGEEENSARFGIRGIHTAKTGHVHDKQDELAKLREAERQKIAQQIEGIYLFTKTVVLWKLGALDVEVDTMFDRDFQAYFFTLQKRVQLRMEDWKSDRYSSLFKGAYRWWRDKLRDINKLDGPMQIYCEEQCAYVKKMKDLLHRISKRVEETLAECKVAIAEGREKVCNLTCNIKDKNLKSFAKEAAGRISIQFDSLEDSVNEKKQELITRLAKRYKESREKVDKWIEEEKARNRSLLVKLANKVREIYDAVVRLKDRLMSVLRKARDVILTIIAHPIRFLENLVDAVKQGVSQFRDRFAEHLKEGVLMWLFGPKVSSDIEAPKDFSLKSIFGLAMGILGITKDKLRTKAAALIGEGNLKVLEKVWEFITVAYQEGPAGLWEHIKEFLGDLKDTILQGLKEWAIKEIVKAAITHLLLMFNPVGAFIGACLAIYDLIKFFIQHFDDIVEMVGAVLSSISDIAQGKVAAAADYIENAMTRSIPLILAFLASLLSIPDPGPALRKIVNGLRERVDKALDWMVGKLKVTALAGLGFAKSVAAKVTSLLFPKKTFLAGADEHTVETKETGDDYQILIRSKEMSVPDLISLARHQSLKEANQLEKAFQLYSKLRVNSKDEKEMKKQGEEKVAAFRKVADLVALIYPQIPSLAGTKIVTNITYGPTDWRGGSLMVAHPLGPDNPGKGSAPSQEADFPPIWKDLDKKRNGHRLYIKGHLLNNKLGGPGNLLGNITPLTYSANKRHFDAAEEALQEEIIKKKKYVHYEVHVNYPGTKRPVPDHVNEDEGWLATSLSTHWYELVPKKAASTELVPKGSPQTETIPHVPPYPQT